MNHQKLQSMTKIQRITVRTATQVLYWPGKFKQSLAYNKNPINRCPVKEAQEKKTFYNELKLEESPKGTPRLIDAVLSIKKTTNHRSVDVTGHKSREWKNSTRNVNWKNPT